MKSFLLLSFISICLYAAKAQSPCIEISGSATKANVNESITFISNSMLTCVECDSGLLAKAYLWKFAGAEPATALGPGPHQVKYIAPGSFDVQLEVSYIHPNNFEQECRKTLVKKEYISIEGRNEAEIKSFTARANNKRIILSWTSFYEDNNIFTVEKSTDNASFTEIATVKGETSKSVTNEYTTDDKNPTKGLAYYRLKFRKRDGSFDYSPAVAVKWIDINELLNIGEGEKVLVVIHDKDGNELYSKVLVKGMENDAIVAVDPYQKISPGTYQIVGSSKNEISNKQLIVQEEK